MGKIAFVFAGQGAQKPGMGKDVCDSISAAKDLFAKADGIRPGTSEQCFEASQAVLSETKNTQPCVYTVDLAIAKALGERGIKADMVAGYSLGELAALAYAGAFSAEEGLRLVSRRGEMMQLASNKIDTGMVAILKLDDEKIEEICDKFDKVFPVNFNCKGQVTVAGVKDQLEDFIPMIKEAGGLARILEVSGGFHSPFMAEAAESFADVLKDAKFNGDFRSKDGIHVYSNRTSEPYGEGADEIRRLLTEQIANPIRWKTLIENMIAEGVDTFIEVGPGTALTKMITRISKDITMLNVCDMESLERTVECLKEKQQ